MSIGEIVFYLAVTIILIVLAGKAFRPSQSDYSKYHDNLTKRLKDPRLYDPESGAKFTVEQGEKGTWIKNDNYSRIKNQDEIDNYYDGKEKAIEHIANILKKEKYPFIKLTNQQNEILEGTQMLSKYDNWSYWHAFQLNETDIVLFPKIQFTYAAGRYSQSFSGYQILFWVQINDIEGHYFLREKESAEKIFDLFRNDDEFKFGDFEVFTIESSKKYIQILNSLKPFKKLKNVEIEIRNRNLFIKTSDEPSVSEFESLMTCIKKNKC